MVKSQLVTALDFAKKKRNPPPNEVYSFRKGDTWYVCRCGNGYSNTYRIVEFDDDGLKRLQELERTASPASV